MNFYSNSTEDVSKTNQALNNQAYDDVLHQLEPSMPENAYYMSCYGFWREIQNNPEDK